MNNFIAVDNGKIRGADDVALADKVLETKKNKGVWDTIDLLVEAWAKKTPEEFNGFKVQMEDYRDNLSDPTYGQTNGGRNQERRFTMVFPQRLFLMIRSIYKSQELPMDRKFYNEFGRRYPLFRVPEKL